MSNNEFFQWQVIGVLLFLVILIMFVPGRYHDQQERKIEELTRNQCAWIFHEDGSVSERDADYLRFKCIEKNGGFDD